jgi:hypothetical protein
MAGGGEAWGNPAFDNGTSEPSRSACLGDPGVERRARGAGLPRLRLSLDGSIMVTGDGDARSPAGPRLGEVA